MSKKCVAYFSYEGHTKKKAESLASELGADLLEIKRRKHYSANRKKVLFSGGAEHFLGIYPALDQLPDIDSYDEVYLGYPIWVGTCPQIIVSFAKLTYKYKGTIIPFYTSMDSTGEKSTQKLKKLYKKATVKDAINMN